MANFRAMRRQDRNVSQPETLLAQCNWGVLSVMGENGYPYGVSVNYGYAQGKIYIHSTNASSHKLDAIRADPRVCFTVVGHHELLEAELSTRYSSVILFGTARILSSEDEKRIAAIQMMQSLAPAVTAKAISDCGNMRNIVMIEITPEHISGKERP